MSKEKENKAAVNKLANVPTSTVTRDLRQLDVQTDNLYESLVIISKRANQISANLKEELHGKLSEFATSNDNLEEVFENREQIEISKHYERMPKPTLVAMDEFLNKKVYFRNPSKETEQ
ncbi:RNA polymerase Rpb6 [bacterium A37T11]|nr:RNA polymerase Rpb6 [bacterium A37T11]